MATTRRRFYLEKGHHVCQGNFPDVVATAVDTHLDVRSVNQLSRVVESGDGARYLQRIPHMQ
jgi:hypothetical protein